MSIRSALILVCSLGAFVACSPSATTEKQVEDSGSPDTGGKADSDASVDSGGDSSAESGGDSGADSGAERSAMIGAAGGSVETSDGAVVLTVPAAAFAKEGKVTLTPEPGGAGDTFASQIIDITLFDPNGNEISLLDNSVEICLRANGGADTSTACLGYLDEKSKTWVCEDECLSKNDKGLLCGSTDHFTQFALLLKGGSGTSDKCHDDLVNVTGGTVVSTDKLATAMFPDGALDKRTRVTVHTDSSKDPNVGSGVYDFTPSMTFKKEVSLCITPNVGASTKAACLGYLDAKTQKWTCEGKCVKESGGQLCGTTTHFTPFAVLLSGGSGVACP